MHLGQVTGPPFAFDSVTLQYCTVQYSTGEISFPVKQYVGIIITHKACHKLTLDNPQSLDGNPIGR